jgi:bacterioferritin-associated ferredoxin
MYVCLCNALTDAQLRAAASAGAARVRDLYAGCGCEAQCGGCAASVLAILREQRAGQTTAP